MKKLGLVLCFFVIASVSITAQDVIEKEVQKAVNGLAGKILSRLRVNIKDVTMAGTTQTSAGSVYLRSLIKNCAVNSNPSLFVVVDNETRGPKDPNEPSTGIISGKYTTRGKTVEVTLELIVDGITKGSQRISVPVSEFGDLSLVPDNFKNQQEAEKQDKNITTITQIIKPPKNRTTQPVQIEAFFDSQLGNRVFMHREPLNLTAMTDKDCYIKVIHIDVDNHMKMIFPNSVDTNNHLIANTERSIFEKTIWYLTDPYGAETLLFIASVNQFENIESDYISPWTADKVTPENFRKVLRGGRGLELERTDEPIENLVEGEARYTITILKPNEEYEYGRPDNMAATVQSMRNDALQQGGTFEGNETSGFSVIGNARVSYRIPRDKPDTIQFAIYNLDTLSRGKRGAARTRGAGHTFSFDKPGNMAQTIQTVRSGIVSKGGAFNGNEQTGSFKASGIEGRYIVTEKVNVTITEKPVLVPNALIEREVKNYFGRSE